MEQNGQEIAVAAPQQQPNRQDFCSAQDILPELSACFALVRPVSMSDAAAAEWLAVAANELAGYETSRIRIGLAEARRTCTHHGQIIPCVFENMKYPWDLGKPLKRQLSRTSTQLPPPEIQGLIDGATKALISR